MAIRPRFLANHDAAGYAVGFRAAVPTAKISRQPTQQCRAEGQDFVHSLPRPESLSRSSGGYTARGGNLHNTCLRFLNSRVVLPVEIDGDESAATLGSACSRNSGQGSP
jgi:hypothetical protein